MDLYEKLLRREQKLSVIGLGYVGLPIAAAFAKHVCVVGFDINPQKIQQYQEGIDPTKEVGTSALSKLNLSFTAQEQALREARFHIVAVPTPVSSDCTPDLSRLEEASRILGRNLTAGSVVVYESTVFPGVTEEVCVPILEQVSGLLCGRDFKVGYSPERINPGDREHRLDSVVKLVSGMDEQTLSLIARVYELVVSAGVCRVGSIKVAEAAKVIENSQRDINIAFMNELSMIFHRMGIDTRAVLEAAGTKWNFLPFSPGLVGGHCIGVDPYYLTYRAQQMGYRSKIIAAGRQVNDSMGRYVAQSLVKALIHAEIPVERARVGILGVTFKENCPDTRNSRVTDILEELLEYGVSPLAADPVADVWETAMEHGIELLPLSDLTNLDAVILAVAHREFAALGFDDFQGMFRSGGRKKVLLDVKGILDRDRYEKDGYLYWRL